MDHILTNVIAHSPSLTELVESQALDTRNNLVFSLRPPEYVKRLITEVQRRLINAQTTGGAAVRGKQLWTMPRESLHITVLEVVHSTTPAAVESLIQTIGMQHLERMVDYPAGKGVRLGKPFLSFDKAALAVSFLPIEGGGDRDYTYHHLRGDLWGMLRKRGIDVSSRYIVPSAHLTVGRFIETGPAGTGSVAKEMERWIKAIDEINDWLEKNGEQYMRGDDGEGQSFWEIDTPLDLRKGLLWYGGGQTVVKV